ncbi:Haloacetate dehalogenase H-1 [Ascidiaceihabitans donghaensis]|uniref:Haloacetate dehalogenase H-1 n=1 Tax=Ascidiaceihabitans donghaensis TaxID=1510460 RepID=A0A2R8BP97_9RHOB|nr:alpha/beta fold hydrolase [Ascidiaceihabitans donghaensis]SPH27343.1 Haloacetate dehalogenase H-1 [Ascidiaceihabitans donghaensis]
MPEFAHDGVTIHYEISGHGPPLLMIAGMLSDSASWAPLVPLLEPHFTLIRPDNRTTGRTRPMGAPASVAHFASDALALLDHLDLQQAHVLGHSMGGAVAMTLARSAPKRVRSLALAAAAPLQLNRNLALFQTLLAIRKSDASPDTWLRALFPWLFDPAVYELENAVQEAVDASLAYPFAQSADAMSHQIAALADFDPTPLLGPYPMPARAFLGENDLLLPVAVAQKALGDIDTVILPGAGHSIHWDVPDVVAHHLTTFTRTA